MTSLACDHGAVLRGGPLARLCLQSRARLQDGVARVGAGWNPTPSPALNSAHLPSQLHSSGLLMSTAVTWLLSRDIPLTDELQDAF